MKRSLAALLLALVTFGFVGCGAEDTTAPATPPAGDAAAPADDATTPATTEEVK